MINSWNYIHLCYIAKENAAFPDGAAEFRGGFNDICHNQINYNNSQVHFWLKSKSTKL